MLRTASFEASSVVSSRSSSHSRLPCNTSVPARMGTACTRGLTNSIWHRSRSSALMRVTAATPPAVERLGRADYIPLCALAALRHLHTYGRTRERSGMLISSANWRLKELKRRVVLVGTSAPYRSDLTDNTAGVAVAPPAVGTGTGGGGADGGLTWRSRSEKTMNHPEVTQTMKVTFDFTKISKLFKSDQETPGSGRGCVGRCVECFVRLRHFRLRHRCFVTDLRSTLYGEQI